MRKQFLIKEKVLSIEMIKYINQFKEKYKNKGNQLVMQMANDLLNITDKMLNFSKINYYHGQTEYDSIIKGLEDCNNVLNSIIQDNIEDEEIINTLIQMHNNSIMDYTKQINKIEIKFELEEIEKFKLEENKKKYDFSQEDKNKINEVIKAIFSIAEHVQANYSNFNFESGTWTKEDGSKNLLDILAKNQNNKDFANYDNVIKILKSCLGKLDVLIKNSDVLTLQHVIEGDKKITKYSIGSFINGIKTLQKAIKKIGEREEKLAYLKLMSLCKNIDDKCKRLIYQLDLVTDKEKENIKKELEQYLDILCSVKRFEVFKLLKQEDKYLLNQIKNNIRKYVGNKAYSGKQNSDYEMKGSVVFKEEQIFINKKNGNIVVPINNDKNNSTNNYNGIICGQFIVWTPDGFTVFCDTEGEEIDLMENDHIDNRFIKCILDENCDCYKPNSLYRLYDEWYICCYWWE